MLLFHLLSLLPSIAVSAAEPSFLCHRNSGSVFLLLQFSDYSFQCIAANSYPVVLSHFESVQSGQDGCFVQQSFLRYMQAMYPADFESHPDIKVARLHPKVN